LDPARIERGFLFKRGYMNSIVICNSCAVSNNLIPASPLNPLDTKEQIKWHYKHTSSSLSGTGLISILDNPPDWKKYFEELYKNGHLEIENGGSGERNLVMDTGSLIGTAYLNSASIWRDDTIKGVLIDYPGKQHIYTTSSGNRLRNSVCHLCGIKLSYFG
jgi:hypothetical protein